MNWMWGSKWWELLANPKGIKIKLEELHKRNHLMEF